MARIPLTWYPEPGTWHLCTILTFQILTEHYIHPDPFGRFGRRSVTPARTCRAQIGEPHSGRKSIGGSLDGKTEIDIMRPLSGDFRTPRGHLSPEA
jgi:hypothetical protein